MTTGQIGTAPRPQVDPSPAIRLPTRDRGEIDVALAQIVSYLAHLSSAVEELRDRMSRDVAAPRPPRVATVTGVVPSATANTYGVKTNVPPTDGYASITAPVYAALTSSGTFGIETLTVRLTVNASDGTSTSIEKTFVVTGGETALTGV